MECAKTIFTVGYAGRDFGSFAGILKSRGVECVADVRRYPGSKYRDFTKANLELALPSRGMDYIHLEKLGGFRRGYEKYAGTPEFREGLGKLVSAAREKTTAVMCAEPSPSACHRRFIARELERMGWTVVHL